MIKVLLADDHAVVRKGIRAMLAESADIQVVAEVADGRAAVQMVKSLSPDIAVLDAAMPRLNGIEATRQIRNEFPVTRVIVFSMHADEQYVGAAFRAGAMGYVLKEAAFDELLAAVQTVARGKVYTSPRLAGCNIEAYRQQSGSETPSAIDRLSKREREVLQMIGEGNSSPEIAATLGLSPRTIETYRENLMTKLNVRTIAGLTRAAIQNGVCFLDM